ncbi:MAG TPA: hypothetical protein VKT80_05905 [Chloroflexota bacterium]|nr:hypothetical protein [Chloroflexota bacterium]
MPKKRLSKSSLLWFIRSRSYVSVPDIRRRFNLEAGEDVHPIVTSTGRSYVGLPMDAARVLGDLVREGRIGLELRPGLMAKVALGVYVVPQPHERMRFDRGYSTRPEPPNDDDGDESEVAALG